MSDSSCSNCNLYNCRFRDYDYDCYVKSCNDLKRFSNHLPQLKETVKTLENMREQTDNEESRFALDNLKSLVEMIEIDVSHELKELKGLYGSQA